MILFLAFLALALPSSAVANGGGITQLSRQPAGPYLVTATTSPSPLKVGLADVSVLVERADTEDLISDAHVSISAQPVDGGVTASTFAATHEQATNKLFYAANVALPQPARWQFQVHVAGAQGQGDAGFQADVQEASLFDEPFTIPALGALGIGLLVWWSLRPPKRPA